MSHGVTVLEAVRLTRYTRQTIYNLIFHGRVPARKVGRAYLIDRRALLAYQKQQQG